LLIICFHLTDYLLINLNHPWLLDPLFLIHTLNYPRTHPHLNNHLLILFSHNPNHQKAFLHLNQWRKKSLCQDTTKIKNLCIFKTHLLRWPSKYYNMKQKNLLNLQRKNILILTLKQTWQILPIFSWLLPLSLMQMKSLKKLWKKKHILAKLHKEDLILVQPVGPSLHLMMFLHQNGEKGCLDLEPKLIYN